MSTIKHSSAHKTASHRPAAHKAAAHPAPASRKPDSKPAREQKPEHDARAEAAGKPGESKPGQSKPGEIGEAGEAKKPGQVDENGKPIDENGKPIEDGKDPKDEFQESDELKNDKEDDEMSQELQGLKDALASLYDMMSSEDDDKQEKAPENLGGCCGKSHGAQQPSESEGNKDWNAILTAGIAAVKAQGLGGQGNLTLLSGGQGQNGKVQAAGAAQSGKGGPQGASQKGAQAGGDPRTRLASDYQKAKAAKAELRPEVENEVRNLLGLPPADGQQSQQTQGAGQGLPKASGF
jgi:hypothetical protein